MNILFNRYINNRTSLNAHIYDLIAKRRWAELSDTLSKHDCIDAIKTGWKGTLPLLTACEQKAPYSIIKVLLQTFPDAAKITDKEGNYALHLACQAHLDGECIRLLVDTFPDALDRENNRMVTPRHYRQSDPLASEYLSKPTVCVKHVATRRKVYKALDEDIESMKEASKVLESRLNESKLRREELRMMLDDLTYQLEQLGFDKTNKAVPSLQNTQGRSLSKISSFKSSVDELRDMLNNHDRKSYELNFNQKKYMEETVEKVKELEVAMMILNDHLDETRDVNDRLYYEVQ